MHISYGMYFVNNGWFEKVGFVYVVQQFMQYAQNFWLKLGTLFHALAMEHLFHIEG
jgi:hypothetical protein